MTGFLPYILLAAFIGLFLLVGVLSRRMKKSADVGRGRPRPRTMNAEEARKTKAAILDKITATCDLMTYLRAEEGDSVELMSDNPDSEKPEDNNAVLCCGDWTGWEQRAFYGESLLAALKNAAAAKRGKAGKVGQTITATWRTQMVQVGRHPIVQWRNKIICIVGSSRFADQAAVAAWEFEKRGIIALSLNFLPEWYHNASGKTETHHYGEQEGVAPILDELHLRKIDMADEVFVINAPMAGHPNGYISERTTIEIAYALKAGKPVKYMQGGPR